MLVAYGRFLNAFSHLGHGFITATGSANSPQSKRLGQPQDCSAGGVQKSLGASSSPKRRSSSSPKSEERNGSPGPSNSGSSGSATLAPLHEWVHLCVDSYTGRTYLKAIDISNTLRDGPMFTKIHEAYFGVGFWPWVRNKLSLKVLMGVEFVHVILHVPQFRSVHSANK